MNYKMRQEPKREYRPGVVTVALDYAVAGNWPSAVTCLFAVGYDLMQAKRLAALAYYFKTRGYDGNGQS